MRSERPKEKRGHFEREARLMMLLYVGLPVLLVVVGVVLGMTSAYWMR